MNSINFLRARLILSLAGVALFCGCQKEKESSAPAPESRTAASSPAIVSAEKTSFDEVTSKLDRGGNLYVYLSTEQVLSNLSEKMTGVSGLLSNVPAISPDQIQTIHRAVDLTSDWLKDSGIEQISGVGMSSIARDPGFYYSKLIVHHYPGKNDGVIWSVLGKEAHPLQELDLLPLTTVLAGSVDFDVPLLWSDLQKRVSQLNLPSVTESVQQLPDQFRTLTGMDFDKMLASLGGNYTWILTMDPQRKVTLPLPSSPLEIPTPGLALIAKVKSDLIFDRIDELAKGNPLVVRVDKPDLKMRSLAIPLPLPIELRPSVARSGDYLILATTDSLIEEILAVKAGKTNGFKSTPEFKRLSQGIPATGNNFFLVADQFVKSLQEMQQAALTNNASAVSAQFNTFSKAFNSGTNHGNYTVGRNSETGWEGYANGSQSMQAMILPLVAGTGALAAVAIPNFVRARTTSQQNACINNLRSIDAAKQQWALENKKENTDTPTEEDLRPYLALGSKKELPTCPAGGVYKMGAVGEKPSCSVAGHVER